MNEENSIFLWEIYFSPVVIVRWSRSVFALFPALNIFIAVGMGGKRGWPSACLGQGENRRQKSHVWNSDGSAIFGT